MPFASALMLLLLFAVGSAACVAAWTWAVVCWGHGQPLLPHEPRRAAPWGLVDLFAAATLFLGSQLLGAGARRGLGIHDGSSAASLAAFLTVVGALSILAGLVTIGWIRLRTGARLATLGLTLRHCGRDVITGGVAFMLVGPPVFMLQAVLNVLAMQFAKDLVQPHPIIKALQANPDAMLFAACTFTAAIAAPLVEELLMRGLFQGWCENLVAFRISATEVLFGVTPQHVSGEFALENPNDQPDPRLKSPPSPLFAEEPASAAARRAGGNGEDQPPVSAKEEPAAPLFATRGWIAIVVASLIFALLHVGQGLAPIPLFFFSLALGYLYQRTHRLLPSMILHALLNSTTMFVLALTLDWWNSGGESISP